MKHARILTLLLASALGLGAADRAPRQPINLNTATATELTQLPRVGARTAQRIVEFRKTHGAFRRAEELMNVKGIGEKGFQRLKAHVVIAATPAAPVKR